MPSARSSAIAPAISSPSAASETTTYRIEKCFSGAGSYDSEPSSVNRMLAMACSAASASSRARASSVSPSQVPRTITR